MNISRSKTASLIPFAYFALTRLNGPRDFAYHAATSWFPAVWLLYRLADVGIVEAMLLFFTNYFAFISIYEIGYLVNDAWDAKRSKEGRHRLAFSIGAPYVFAFLGIRIGLWNLIAIRTGWIAAPLWIAGYGVLLLALAQHNLIRSKGLRVISFYALATLRFLLPILALLPTGAAATALLIALLLYAFPRLLGYMESKELLVIEGRKTPAFGFLLYLSLSPLLLFLAFWIESIVLVEMLAYYLLIRAGWWGFVRIADPSASSLIGDKSDKAPNIGHGPRK